MSRNRGPVGPVGRVSPPDVVGFAGSYPQIRHVCGSGFTKALQHGQVNISLTDHAPDPAGDRVHAVHRIDPTAADGAAPRQDARRAVPGSQPGAA